ncbi:hypothetical protein [Pelagibaculum spongiae]|uniref:Uncharacterized protein n=1 Tax=Pelagibaculum spongiae TaxID=2080658 RepID=A0A2V1GVU3_9GAMM|nr:hypothetical protein [Pelagibaculum spongiae]PVZ69454.1 hypothetical protein DC094_08940 [Pelagibaculum spongiae]
MARNSKVRNSKLNSQCPACNQQFKPDDLLNIAYPKQQPWYKFQRFRKACPHCKVLLSEVPSMWKKVHIWLVNVTTLLSVDLVIWVIPLDRQVIKGAIIMNLVLMAVVMYFEHDYETHHAIKYRKL